MPTSDPIPAVSSPVFTCPLCQASAGPRDITGLNCGISLALATALAERQVLSAMPEQASAPPVAEVIAPRFGEHLLNNGYI